MIGNRHHVGGDLLGTMYDVGAQEENEMDTASSAGLLNLRVSRGHKRRSLPCIYSSPQIWSGSR